VTDRVRRPTPGSLAGGAVVHTTLEARLLGLRLLVVDGTITLWPARPAEVVVDSAEPVRALPRPAPAPGVVGARLPGSARRLAEAERRLRELDS
jgi:hypothetical protein